MRDRTDKKRLDQIHSHVNNFIVCLRKSEMDVRRQQHYIKLSSLHTHKEGDWKIQGNRRD